LGEALQVKGDLDRAVAAYRKVLEIEPKLAFEVFPRLGLALQQKGDLEGAIAAFGRAVELNPRSAPAHNDLAWVLATCPDPKLRDPGRPVERARKAVDLAPKEGGCYNPLGVALYRLDAADPAVVAALTRSVELRQGGDAVDFFFLAMTQAAQGNRDDART